MYYGFHRIFKQVDRPLLRSIIGDTTIFMISSENLPPLLKNLSLILKKFDYFVK